MKGRAAYGFSALTILGILILSNTAFACFSPTDSFATEVLLSKPGVSYNLSGIIESDNVIVKTKEVPVEPSDAPEPQTVVIEKDATTADSEPVETRTELDAIIYRSHYNPDVAVILSEDRIPVNGEWIEGRYLSVKVQVPTKDVRRSMPFVGIELTGNTSIADLDLNTSADLGWKVTEYERKDACTLEKNNIRINMHSGVRYPPIPDEEDLSPEELRRIKELHRELESRGELSMSTQVSIAIKDAGTLEVRDIDDERCNWQPPGMDVLGPCEMEVGYYYDKRYGCTCLSGCTKPAGIPFDSSEECEAVCGRGAGNEIADVLVAIGFFEDEQEALEEISNWEQRTSEWDDLEPAIDISGFNYVTALIVELDWLSENEVIENLTERDLDGMRKVAYRGTAGFNSRIVYEDGAWLPYSETGNPMLLRGIDCSGFSITELPDGIISSVPAPSHTPSTSVHGSDRVPAFTAFAAIAGLLAVACMRRRR